MPRAHESPGNESPSSPPQQLQISSPSPQNNEQLLSPPLVSPGDTTQKVLPDYLRPFVPTFQNAQNMRNKIIGLLVSFKAFRHPQIDIESLAHDIFLEAWDQEEGRRRPITAKFVQDRLHNALRNNALYRRRSEEATKVKERQWVEKPSDQVVYDAQAAAVYSLGKIFLVAQLISNEVEVVFDTYFAQETQEQQAKKRRRSLHLTKKLHWSAMEKLKRAGRIVQSEQAREHQQGNSK